MKVTARTWYPSLIATQGEQALFGLDALRVQYDANWELYRSLKRLLENKDAQAALAIGGWNCRSWSGSRAFLGVTPRTCCIEAIWKRTPGKALEVTVGVPANANSNQRFLTLEAMRSADSKCSAW
jgi:molecular chaperone DnaK (HSP70)